MASTEKVDKKNNDINIENNKNEEEPTKSENREGNEAHLKNANAKKRKSRFDDAPPPEKQIKTNVVEKEKTLESALLMARRYTAHSGSGTNTFEAKVPIPDSLLKDKEINFVGLMIGPGGQTQKKLQRDLQSKINILAPGGEKVSKETTEGLYFLITSTSQQRLDVAVAYINQLIDDPAQREALQIDQGYLNSGSFVPQLNNPFGNTAFISHGGPGNEIVMIPAEKVGILIGKGGETIQDAMKRTGALIKVEREHNPTHPSTREVTIQGTPDQVEAAKTIIHGYCSDRSFRQDGQAVYEDYMAVPQNLIGIIIGKAGETIKNIQKMTNCFVMVVPQSGDPMDTVSPKVVKMRGTMQELNAAKHHVSLLTSKYQTNPKMMNSQIGTDVEIIAIPTSCVGTLLGKGGESVKRLAFLSGTRIQVLTADEQSEPGFDSVSYKKVSIKGDKDCIEKAKDEIQKLIDVLAAQPTNPQEIVNPYSATTPEEAQALLQKYMSQQNSSLPSWAVGSVINPSMGGSYAQQGQFQDPSGLNNFGFGMQMGGYGNYFGAGQTGMPAQMYGMPQMFPGYNAQGMQQQDLQPAQQQDAPNENEMPSSQPPPPSALPPGI